MSNPSGVAFANLHTKYRFARAELPPAAELVALVEDGLTQYDIADMYGCSQATVGQRLRDSGLLALRNKPEPVRDELLDIFSGVGGTDWDWVEDALCAQVDTEAFYPEKGGSTREAKSVCARCPVAAECLDTAIANNERFGIWGGKSERERRVIAAELQNATTPNQGIAS